MLIDEFHILYFVSLNLLIFHLQPCTCSNEHHYTFMFIIFVCDLTKVSSKFEFEFEFEFTFIDKRLRYFMSKT